MTYGDMVSREPSGPQLFSFKVTQKVICMPKKEKGKKGNILFFSVMNFNVFVVGLSELKIKKIFSLLSYDEKQLFTKRDKKIHKNEFFTPLYYKGSALLYIMVKE